MSTTKVKASEIVSWLLCPTAYAYGYDTGAVFGNRQRQFAIEKALAQGKDIEPVLKRVVTQATEAGRWWYQSDLFAFLAGSSIYTAPPSPDPQDPATHAQWRRFGPRNRGLVSVSLQNHEVQIEFTVPYMHASKNRTRYECVVFDTEYCAALDARWTTLVQLCRVRQRLFYMATGKHLYTRYVNFATCTEKVIEAKPIELEWVITLLSIAEVSHFARPGAHCHRTSKNEYVCKARENNQCPIW